MGTTNSKGSQKSGWRLLKVTGIALCAAAILFNHWVLAALFSEDNALGAKFKTLIWLFQFACLALGLYLISAGRKVENPGVWIRKKYAFIAIQFFNFFLLFAAVNGIALLFLEEPIHQGHPEIYSDPLRLYHSDREFLREKIYPGRTDEDIWELINPPSSKANPVIEYVGGPHRSKHYNIGFESLRYDSFVNDDNAAELINGSTWVFGGSTLFGAGLSDNETIVHYLNEIDGEKNTYLNFGFPSYHQNLEIEKLQLLLKKGYRPQRVIFLDAWNDFTALRASNFHPAETPAKNQHAYGSVTSIEVVRHPPVRSLLAKLPVFKLLFSMAEKQKLRSAAKGGGSGEYDDIYRADALYHTDPLTHYTAINEGQFDYASLLGEIEFFEAKVQDYYRMNAKYLDSLAKGFGFEYHVFFQPLGSLSKTNPFLVSPDKLESHPYYKITSSMLEAARELTRDGGLANYHDISGADAELGHSYVDAAHYAPALCRAIAESILETFPVEPGSAPDPETGN